MTYKAAALAALLPAALVSGKAQSQDSAETYAEHGKGSVTVALGAAGFANAVVSYAPGDIAPVPAGANPTAALGPPDHRGSRNGGAWVSLGCGGALTLAFPEPGISDGLGADIYVFEAGREVEATMIAISRNGTDWIEIGPLPARRTAVDIADKADLGVSYPYLRLTDTGKACNSRFPGADIDAVAVISGMDDADTSENGAIPFAEGSASLSDAGAFAIKSAALRLLRTSPEAIEITGYISSAESVEVAEPEALAQARADAVRAYLALLPEAKGVTLLVRSAPDPAPPKGDIPGHRVELRLPE
ncbi:hypothetical protein IV417_03835 [Alphaproteobacteria bacterium KMM 3653]|uniref:OmpA-like domain-containing protein n=1 Tax=Harenicola maris TaxID=2841044 RepID=A0AAP2CMW1_9RHOB|nr:hypothetical protein [Harenicola maris]